LDKISDISSKNLDRRALAIKLAERQGDKLELLHVIDPGQTPSTPDALMGLQYSIEMLARSLKALKRNAHALLLFGCLEKVMSKRAADINATLVAFPLDGPERFEEEEAGTPTNRKVACPIVTFSVFPTAAKRGGQLA
jgi:hypothetical protein